MVSTIQKLKCGDSDTVSKVYHLRAMAITGSRSQLHGNQLAFSMQVRPLDNEKVPDQNYFFWNCICNSLFEPVLCRYLLYAKK